MSPEAVPTTTEAPQTPAHVHPGRRMLVLAARALSYVVYAYVILVEIILAFGFFFLLFGANPTSDFVRWVYRSMDRAMAPFRGMFTPVDLGNTPGNEVSSVFDSSVLFAMIVYGLLALFVGGIITWLTERLERLEREDAEARRRAQYEADRATAAPAPAQSYTGSAGGSGTPG